MKRVVDVLARVGTELGAPWVLVIMVAVPAGFLAHRPWWGVALAVCASVLPQSLIVWKRGFDDRHARGVDRRFEYAVTTVPVISFTLAAAIAGERSMAYLSGAMLLTLVLCAVVTGAARWKVSVHAAVSAGAVLIWWALGLPAGWAAAAAVLPLWVSWSRVRIKDHTGGQVVVGALCGVAAGIAFALVGVVG